MFWFYFINCVLGAIIGVTCRYLVEKFGKKSILPIVIIICSFVAMLANYGFCVRNLIY